MQDGGTLFMNINNLIDYWKDYYNDMDCIHLERGYYCPSDPKTCWIAVMDRKKRKVSDRPIIKCICQTFVKAYRKPTKLGKLNKFCCPECGLKTNLRLRGWKEMFAPKLPDKESYYL